MERPLDESSINKRELCRRHIITIIIVVVMGADRCTRGPLFSSRKVLSKRRRSWTSLCFSRLTAFSSKTTDPPRSVLRRFINSRLTPVVSCSPTRSGRPLVFRTRFSPFQSPSFPSARTRSFPSPMFPHPLRSSSTP